MQEFWDSGDVKDLAAYLEREGIDMTLLSRRVLR